MLFTLSFHHTDITIKLYNEFCVMHLGVGVCTCVRACVRAFVRVCVRA